MALGLSVHVTWRPSLPPGTLPALGFLDVPPPWASSRSPDCIFAALSAGHCSSSSCQRQRGMSQAQPSLDSTSRTPSPGELALTRCSKRLLCAHDSLIYIPSSDSLPDSRLLCRPTAWSISPLGCKTDISDPACPRTSLHPLKPSHASKSILPVALGKALGTIFASAHPPRP